MGGRRQKGPWGSGSCQSRSSFSDKPCLEGIQWCDRGRHLMSSSIFCWASRLKVRASPTKPTLCSSVACCPDCSCYISSTGSSSPPRVQLTTVPRPRKEVQPVAWLFSPQQVLHMHSQEPCTPQHPALPHPHQNSLWLPHIFSPYPVKVL